MIASDEIFSRGLDVFTEVVDAVPAESWGNASPCEGWTALDVLGHLTTAIGMGVSLLNGEQPTWPTFERPADLIDGDPAAAWAAVAVRAHAAIEGADLDLVMDTPMGPRSVADRLAFPAIDLFVHAWDIGQAVGIEVEVPSDVIEFAHGYLDPIPQEKMRGEGGAFGPEVEPASDASATETFVAWTGRRPLAE